MRRRGREGQEGYDRIVVWTHSNAIHMHGLRLSFATIHKVHHSQSYVQVHCTRQPNNITLNSSVYTVPMSRVNAGSPTAVLALQKALLSEEGSVHVSNVDLLYTDRRGSPT